MLHSETKIHEQTEERVTEGLQRSHVNDLELVQYRRVGSVSQSVGRVSLHSTINYLKNWTFTDRV